jgi:chromosomal replication initiator protein DnaA
VLLELGVPQGAIVSRLNGSDGLIERVLESARSSGFTGYVKVVLAKDGDRSESIVALTAGMPTICLYVFRPLGMDEIWFLGDKAAEYLWYDACRPEASITTHADVVLKDYEQLFPGARVRRVEAPWNILPSEKVRSDKVRRADSENAAERVLSAIGPREADKKAERQAQGVYDLILQYHKMRSDAPGINACEDCGGPVDLLGYCPRCATHDEGDQSTARMDSRATFATFVVGPGSRFAEAAARAVASDPGHRYNPLTIHGRSGLGKTHLLQAIGQQMRKGREKMNVTYLALESVDNVAVDPKHGSLRHDLETADALLLDDVQYLTGKERLQDELLRTINRLMAMGRQVVLTADRPPREIPALSDRFISRLESGLVADLGPLDQATRLAILKRVAAEGKVPDDVLNFLSEMCPDNVRQLEGGMNRVLAFASLMGSVVTLDLAREVLGTGKAAEVTKVPAEAEVQEGRSYIVEEARPDRSYDLLGTQIDKGMKALVFSRNNPVKVSERIGGRAADIYWLTEREAKGVRTVPPSLEKIVLLAEDHIQKNEATVVMLDDLHYLISNATFEGVIRFIRSLVDQVSERRAVLMVSVSPDSLKVQERSVLERELEPVRP